MHRAWGCMKFRHNIHTNTFKQEETNQQMYWFHIHSINVEPRWDHGKKRRILLLLFFFYFDSFIYCSICICICVRRDTMRRSVKTSLSNSPLLFKEPSVSEKEKNAKKLGFVVNAKRKNREETSFLLVQHVYSIENYISCIAWCFAVDSRLYSLWSTSI